MKDLNENIEKAGTISEGEYHPAANSAMQYVQLYRRINIQGWLMLKESCASCAIEDNKLGAILLSTMERLDTGNPVSDRYLLGLAWYIRQNLDPRHA